MKYLLKEEIRGEENTAGVKARDDIDEILICQLGYTVLDYVTENTESQTLIDNISGHFRKSKEFEKATMVLKNGDELVVQFPMLADSIFHYRIFRQLKKRGVKVILIVHDLELFRVSKRRDVPIKKRIKNKIEEKNVLKCAGEIIVHNTYMRDALAAEGLSKTKMKLLNIFDYLVSGYDKNAYKLSEHIGFGKPVIIAGALRRHKAGYAYNLPEGYQFNLYGIGYEGEPRDNVSYLGVFMPGDLPFEMEGSFGLVWDGLEADTCSGVYGEYLKINNPHKTSLYLAAGIPVIIWAEAALADYIKENNCGITVSSLKDIPDKLKELSEKDYVVMKFNAGKMGKRLREGYYTKQIFKS